MSTKNKLLYDQFFKKYITGDIDGIPRVPSNIDINKQIEAVNIDDSKPTMRVDEFDELTFEKLNTLFLEMIDDLDLLYDSIGVQSNKIMDQLTNSLKEYRGVKFALRKLKNESMDITQGKTGIDNIRYVYTEAFSNTNNINDALTTKDENTSYPVVDVSAGMMYIPSNNNNIIDFQHYYYTKLNVLPTNYTGTILKSGFRGSSDLGVVLDAANDDKLQYEITTSSSTSIILSFVLQLKSDNAKAKINNLNIILDSAQTKGHLRVSYKTELGWEVIDQYEAVETEGGKSQDVVPTMKIKNDKISLQFLKEIETSHLKLSFFKDGPDDKTTNTSYLTINDISVGRADSVKAATLISNSTQVKPYSVENPVLGTIAAEIDGVIPTNCRADVYVAKDKIIKGYYLDNLGNYVLPDSLNRFEFVKASGLFDKHKYSLLSDIIGQNTISGVNAFNHIKYDWELLKSFNTDDMKPDIINFLNLNKKDPFDNSLSSSRLLLWGDSYYTEQSGTYPQSDYFEPLDDWFMSGVVQPSNPNWSGMLPYTVLNANLLGADYGTPSGYPFNWYNTDKEATLKFNDFSAFIPGWDRPATSSVTPSGVTAKSIPSLSPDFYINGIKFYKIYKFLKDSDVIGSDINIFTYQTKPVNSQKADGTHDNIDYYPHNMVWHYVNKFTPIKEQQIEYPRNPIDYTKALNSGVIKLDIPEDGVFIENSIKDVHYNVENLFLNITTQYTIDKVEDQYISFDQAVEKYYEDGFTFGQCMRWNRGDYTKCPPEPVYPIESEYPKLITGLASGLYLNFDVLGDDDIILDSGKTIAFNYAYNQSNKYQSYWKGYIIIDDDNVDVELIQDKTDGSNPENIVENYSIKNTETNLYVTVNDGVDLINGVYNKLDESKTITLDRGIYEIVIHCLTDDKGSYPAKKWSPNSSKFIKVIGNAKIVAEIKPLQIISLETLLFTTRYENDFRCSVIEEVDGFNYVVVKEPSKGLVPGYYFDDVQSSYIKYEDDLIQNIGHYKRKYLKPSGINSVIDYITGSEDLTIKHPQADDISNPTYYEDNRWNKGKLYPTNFTNTDDILYPVHSTYGHSINVDDTFDGVDSKGNLYYNTGENLAAFYTITYGLVDKTEAAIDRFLYKVDLISNHKTLSPILDSIKFTMNTNLEEL